MTDRPLYDKPEIVRYYPAQLMKRLGNYLLNLGTMDFFLMNLKILMRKWSGPINFVVKVSMIGAKWG